MEFIRPITIYFFQYSEGAHKPHHSNLDAYATISDAKSLEELRQEWNQISFRPRTCCILEDTDKILVGGAFDWDRLEHYITSGGLSY